MDRGRLNVLQLKRSLHTVIDQAERLAVDIVTQAHCLARESFRGFSQIGVVHGTWFLDERLDGYIAIRDEVKRLTMILNSLRPPRSQERRAGDPPTSICYLDATTIGPRELRNLRETTLQIIIALRGCCDLRFALTRVNVGRAEDIREMNDALLRRLRMSGYQTIYCGDY